MATSSKPARSLESSILAAFKEAQSQERLDVAEHLLRALECLGRRSGRSGAIEQAYRMICDCGSGNAEDGPGEGSQR
jgi:hypothetical protein